MKGWGVCWVIFLISSLILKAQYVSLPLKNDLSEIPQVQVIVHDSAFTGQNLELAFTTLDSKLALHKPLTDPTSFQIVSAARPFPPKVFATTKLPRYRSGESYFLQDFRQQAPGISTIYLNFVDSTGSRQDGYLVMKQDAYGRYMVLDSFLSNDNHEVDAHSFVIDKNGYYWFLTYQYHTYDMSYRTHNRKDTAAAILTTKVNIWDPAHGKPVFEMDLWEKGLLKIDSIPMDVIELDTAHLTYDVAHANSWLPAGEIDGCPVGALSDLMDGVKFIKLCDSSVLRYGASASDFKPLDKADHHLFFQHDFKLIQNGPYKGLYACFSDGSTPNTSYKSATVPILKFDFKAKTVQMVYEYKFPEIYSIGRGNIDFAGDYMLVNFGLEKSKIEGLKRDSHYRDSIPSWIIKNVKTGQLAASYFLPTTDHAYNVWFMKQDKKLQPGIVQNGGNLILSKGPWNSPLWNNGAMGEQLKPNNSGKYFLTVNGGSIFRFVSNEINFELPVAKPGK